MDTRNLRNFAFATLVGVTAFSVSGDFFTAPGSTSLVTQAEARIGRPGTPLSVAGVARRTTRRAVWAGTVAGGALGLGYGYGYGGYPYSSNYAGYPSYGSYSSYGYGYGDPYSYASYGYGSGYSSYGATYGYYRPWGLRRGWW
jgi:hypothetical protein